MKCYGCVLWQATDDANPWGVKPTGSLFMLGTWFPKGASIGIHNLRFDDSLAGTAVLSRRMQDYPDIRPTKVEHRYHTFLELHELNQTLVAPMHYHEEGAGAVGAISLYRKASAPRFDDESKAQLATILEVLPTLIASSRQAARLELLGRVGQAFNLTANRGKGPLPFRRALSKITTAISHAFHTCEAMVVLRVSERDDENFRCGAATWARTAPTALRKRLSERVHRAVATDRSFTSLCLTARLPVRVLDLSKPQADIKAWRALGFTDFGWGKVEQVEADARAVLGVNKTATLPPLSFMAGPILHGDELIGAVRCWVPRLGLAYFSHADEQLLEAVAAQIAQAWKADQQRRSVEIETAAWRMAAETLVERDPLQYGGEHSGEVSAMCIDALNLADQVFSTSLVNDVQLLDHGTNELVSAYRPVLDPARRLQGSAWDAKFKRGLSVDRASPDPAVSAFRSREVVVVEVGPDYSSRFERVSWMIAAPIPDREGCRGVLTIRGDGAVPNYGRTMASLIGSRLGLQLGVLRDRAVTDRALEQKRSNQESMARALQAINHQMRGPLIQAVRMLRSVADKATSPELQDRLSHVQALVEDARRACRSAALFAEIERGGTVRERSNHLSPDQIAQIVHSAICYIKVGVDPDRRLQVDFDQSTLKHLPEQGLHLDEELLQHALSNLIDNACKYSYRDTTVQIEFGRNKRGLYLSVVNQGLEITREEARDLTRPGYRGTRAQLSTGEGAGLGLSIVDKVMSAMGGRLHIEPTDRRGKNHFRLYVSESL
jgi:signal transduction histidine kinase